MVSLASHLQSLIFGFQPQTMDLQRIKFCSVSFIIRVWMVHRKPALTTKKVIQSLYSKIHVSEITMSLQQPVKISQLPSLVNKPLPLFFIHSVHLSVSLTLV